MKSIPLNNPSCTIKQNIDLILNYLQFSAFMQICKLHVADKLYKNYTSFCMCLSLFEALDCLTLNTTVILKFYIPFIFLKVIP